MDRAAFRAALAELDPDDRAGLIGAVQRRVRALSSRHVDIQDRIDDSETTRRDLERRLEEAEAEIVAQADESVEADVDSIADVEALPDDVAVEFDPALLAEVRDIREEARGNYRRTAEEGADLQAELADNSDELECHQEVLAALEDGELTTATARERLLDFFGEDGADEGTTPDDDEIAEGEAAGDDAG